jgi:hypothetical protein
MFGKKKIALSAAIILSTALTASAATRHHGVADVHHRAIYNMVPADTAAPVSGAPLRTQPDSW